MKAQGVVFVESQTFDGIPFWCLWVDPCRDRVSSLPGGYTMGTVCRRDVEALYRRMTGAVEAPEPMFIPPSPRPEVAELSAHTI